MNIKRAKIEIKNAIEAYLQKDDFGAVSYTHLDVYKRQLKNDTKYIFISYPQKRFLLK